MDPEQIPLRDLHLPDATGWWPLAPGWWLLLGLVALGILLLLRKAWLKWRQDAPRRFALKELARVQAAYYAERDPVTLGLRLSQLLRRTMLAYSPRKQVAGLTGREWLEWLDRGLDEKLFSEGPGRSLQDLPYRRADAGADSAPRDVDAEGLIDAVRRRLRSPLSPPREPA
ncbi:MAG: DUF4381 domain-containing protein [Woeseia sp.]